MILKVYDAASGTLARGIPLQQILSQPFFTEVARAKYTPEKEVNKIDQLAEKIVEELKSLQLEEEVRERPITESREPRV
jgi:V/A-type H+-transporting ATPase subunit A